MTVFSVLDDPIDREILAHLEREGRISWRELGELVGLGPTATSDRVRSLEQRGVISGYRAQINLGALGIGLEAVVEALLHPDTDSDAFEAALASTAEVRSAVHVTGHFDYLIVLACADVGSLDHILRGWKSDGGVLESSTRIILNDVDLAG
jgi:Lrp/AsnC family leucine-responsive transcriptional regulator